MSFPTLDQLIVFAAVSETGSFSAAARRLGRAQSAVSYAIAEIERLLEVTLFDRRTYRPQLTPVGEVLLSHARTVIGEIQRLEAVARATQENVEARITVAVDAIFPLRVLRDAVRAFAMRYPETELVVRIESKRTIARMLEAETVALGICADVPKVPGAIERRALRSFSMVAVASPDHPLFAHEGDIPARALRRHVQIVLTERDPEAYRAEGEAMAGGRVWRVTDLTLKHEWLRAGLGWGFMPTDWIASDLRSARLRRLSLATGSEAQGTFFAIYASSHPPGPAATFLLERMR